MGQAGPAFIPPCAFSYGKLELVFDQFLIQLIILLFPIGKNRTEVIDHYTCTSRGKYLDNFSLPKPKKEKVNGKWIKEKIKAGLIIAIQLHETLKKYFARASIVFLGADSCATNTGWKNGAIGKKYALKK